MNMGIIHINMVSVQFNMVIIQIIGRPLPLCLFQPYYYAYLELQLTNLKHQKY